MIVSDDFPSRSPEPGFELLRTARGSLDLSRPVCMGVLNLTPDSFHDGATLGEASAGKFSVNIDKALRRADDMLAEGARLIDVGGESTRPGARHVPLQEELDRVLPMVEALRARFDAIVSVDTSSPEVMRAAVAAGAGMINDVRALSRPGAIETVAETDAAICLMHMRGEPDTMQQEPEYKDVVAEVSDFLRRRANAAAAAGIDQTSIVIDPGFGFGKKTRHNFTLLRELREFTGLGYPVLAGLSRKSMIGAATGRPTADRLPGTIAAVTLALHGGARIIRSHDVAATVDAIGVHSMLREER